MMEVETLATINPLGNVDPHLSDEELYLKVKDLQADIEMLKIQEDFIREE
jgi:hypothetical protein